MCFRYQTPKQCLGYLIFWSNVAENSPINSYRLSDVFVKILIQNLYDGLDNQSKEQFIIAKPVEKNLKTWIAFGIRRNSLSSSKYVQNAEDALKKCFSQPNSDNYYSMVGLLSKLSLFRQIGRHFISSLTVYYLFELI